MHNIYSNEESLFDEDKVFFKKTVKQVVGCEKLVNEMTGHSNHHSFFQGINSGINSALLLLWRLSLQDLL